MKPRKIKATWSTKDKKLLLQALSKYNDDDLDAITAEIPTKRKSHVFRYIKSLKAKAKNATMGTPNVYSVLANVIRLLEKCNDNNNALIWSIYAIAHFENHPKLLIGNTIVNFKDCYLVLLDFLRNRTEHINNIPIETTKFVINTINQVLKLTYDQKSHLSQILNGSSHHLRSFHSNYVITPKIRPYLDEEEAERKSKILTSKKCNPLSFPFQCLEINKDFLKELLN